MEIRKAEISDIDILTNNRIEFVTSITSIQDINEFRAVTKKYLENHLNDGSLLCYIVVEEGRIIASCMLCIYTTIPIPSCLNGKSGILLNVYTAKAYRRQGLASMLITKLIDDAKALGVHKILLDYTDDGYPLYKSLEFKELDRQMELKL
jgi:Acetyltransferases